ncbi:hypothetical protein JG688_00013932 [Phytophthora aleatoria]|uniref:Uncharacterized protein n=1 Tax=Phytophthora aleatoria TaxID=2496075 RepID=A0A8J5ILB0_9STRA|nr:hypothetical protein JG688_00013932 [Phytophthora aleatoria]
MTKAAWSRNNEFISHVEGQADECSRFNSLLEKCVRTTPSDLTLTKGNRYSSEPTKNGSQNTQDTQNTRICNGITWKSACHSSGARWCGHTTAKVIHTMATCPQS